MNFLKKKFFQFYIKFLRLIRANDRKMVKAKYFLKNNQSLNLNNPVEFMEKIQWLKLNLYTEKYGNFVDKFEVRKYVSETIGNEFLNEIFAVYDDVETIDYEKLPIQFVLKATHGSGYNIIVTDKNTLNINEVNKKLKKFLSLNYYNINRELIYSKVKPRIIIEKYISDKTNCNIIDYKFYSFNGVPKYVLVKTSFAGIEKKCFYDMSWIKINQEKLTDNYFEGEFERPNNFNEMVLIATKLSEGFIFIRVDLYSIQNKILFGELTFFPTGGNKRFDIEKFNFELGNLIQLPTNF